MMDKDMQMVITIDNSLEDSLKLVGALINDAVYKSEKDLSSSDSGQYEKKIYIDNIRKLRLTTNLIDYILLTKKEFDETKNR